MRCHALWRVFNTVHARLAENAFISGLAYISLPDDEKALA
jgi:hypothetical protein